MYFHCSWDRHLHLFMSSSHYLVAASGQPRPAKPSGALCSMQSTTTCCTDCVMCPQAHVADSWTSQSFKVTPTRAVPQRRRFSFTHCLRWRSAPGGSTGLGWGQAVRMRGGPLSTRSLHYTPWQDRNCHYRVGPAACLLNGRREKSLCGQAASTAVTLEESCSWRSQLFATHMHHKII